MQTTDTLPALEVHRIDAGRVKADELSAPNWATHLNRQIAGLLMFSGHDRRQERVFNILSPGCAWLRTM